MKKGLRAHATLVVSDQRVQVILKPSPGWTSLCTQAWSEQCPYEYHISLCYDWECTPEEVSEAMKDFDGWDMKLKIKRVSYNYVAILRKTNFLNLSNCYTAEAGTMNSAVLCSGAHHSPTTTCVNRVAVMFRGLNWSEKLVCCMFLTRTSGISSLRE